jgi:hypothetical protein
MEVSCRHGRGTWALLGTLQQAEAWHAPTGVGMTVGPQVRCCRPLPVPLPPALSAAVAEPKSNSPMGVGGCGGNDNWASRVFCPEQNTMLRRWICFRPHVKCRESPTQLVPLETPNSNHSSRWVRKRDIILVIGPVGSVREV